MPSSPPTFDATGVTSSPPTCWALFKNFFLLGVMAFGGALPLARHMVVEKNRWLSPDAFTELLGLCQFLPGGNMINMSVALGLKFRGVKGGFVALMGLILAPSLIIISLGMVYDRYANDPHIQHLFAGLAAAAAGLLISMAVKIARPLRGQWFGIAVAVICFVCIAVLRFPLVSTMLVLTPISILVSWRLRR
ncbi:chromate transporter [Bordetella sp. 02P26C-1]|uniref:chromate transporter n=1 Tax=Bordetella sp. 02P26C-1 TaxID=2683195 RepID=UPI00135230BE|nr:chromate transporter [Bordetella sp. 02P26C-1]MVW79508.1 chromate transporter [Bordetella sp. 02P26C-1]